MATNYTGGYNVLTDTAGAVIPINLSAAQAIGGINFDVSAVSAPPSGNFGFLKGFTLDLSGLTAGSVTVSSLDLSGWSVSCNFGSYQSLEIPGQAKRLTLTASAGALGSMIVSLMNTPPTTSLQTLANLNATISGNVAITALGNVSLTNPYIINQQNPVDQLPGFVTVDFTIASPAGGTVLVNPPANGQWIIEAFFINIGNAVSASFGQRDLSINSWLGGVAGTPLFKTRFRFSGTLQFVTVCNITGVSIPVGATFGITFLMSAIISSITDGWVNAGVYFRQG